METVLRWAIRLAAAGLLVSGTIVLLRAFDARRRLPELKRWHRYVPKSEARAPGLSAPATLADYLAIEERVFAEVRDQVVAKASEEDRSSLHRYWEGSRTYAPRFSTDWNRSREWAPEEIRAGALLVHGLSDSPYSMRALAESLRRRGVHSLAIRMPGHGTVPGALTDTGREDWLAAVALGARHVRARIGEGRPLYLVGYSSGAALVLKHSLDALSDPGLVRADRIVLISPMIGLARFANLTRFLGVLGGIRYFEKSRWFDVLPEYNPFKYNSFPIRAASEAYDLTEAVHAGVLAAREAGRLGALPPVLAFQSLVDSTVSSDAVIERLFLQLGEKSELVLFDLNRSALVRPFLRAGDEERLQRMLVRERRCRLSAVVNASAETDAVVERSFGNDGEKVRPLGLSWPPQVYSLSHIALPFPIEDPLYGLEPSPEEDFGVRLGRISPRGERGVLAVPVDHVLRLGCNPFYPYLEEKMGRWLGLAAAPPGPEGGRRPPAPVLQ